MVRCFDCKRTNKDVRRDGWFCERKNVNCQHHTVEEERDHKEYFER